MSTIVANPDYLKEFEDKQLPLNLYDEYDDERGLWIKPRLENLVNGILTPKKLAIDVDTRITEDTNRKRTELMKRLDPRNLTEEEDYEDRIVPRLRYHISPLLSTIVGLCTAFPAYRPGQTRIVEFLLALQSLPRHEIYVGLSPEGRIGRRHPRRRESTGRCFRLILKTRYKILDSFLARFVVTGLTLVFYSYFFFIVAHSILLAEPQRYHGPIDCLESLQLR